MQYKNILAPNALTWDQIQKWQKKQRKAEMQKKFYALLLILKLDYILKCNRADLEQKSKAFVSSSINLLFFTPSWLFSNC